MRVLGQTKQVIFKEAIILFANKGYNSVSMKEIAEAVGIKAASIYNHFESKSEILDDIYQYYIDHSYDQRKTLAEFEPILKNGSASEIMAVISYNYDEEHAELLLNVSRIIWSRIYIDDRAKEIYQKYVVENGTNYVVAVMSRLVELGRLEMTAKDMQLFASIVNASRIFVANGTVVEPHETKWTVLQTEMISYLANTLELSK